jgi:uncharacterized protein (DUF169 family)
MDKYVVVYNASDITVAYLIKSVLENAGIPVQITNENLQGAYCVDGMVPGVLVPEACVEQARQLIQEMQQSSQNGLDDEAISEKFLRGWEKYFDGAELPIAFYYTDEPAEVEVVEPAAEHRCIMAEISNVRAGKSICFNADSFSCLGGKRYLGFSQEVMPNFEYFLSCGITGKLEGERYRKTPELVNELMKKVPKFEAPGKFIVFKRLDMLEESDEPDVVIFFAHPDVLSGLFTLANFDEGDVNGVFCPFSAGCGSIVQYPYLEKESDCPKAVLGMFDVSARPFVSEDVLSFSVPVNKLTAMVENMEESFLITQPWDRVHKRILQKKK